MNEAGLIVKTFILSDVFISIYNQRLLKHDTFFIARVNVLVMSTIS